MSLRSLVPSVVYTAVGRGIVTLDLDRHSHFHKALLSGRAGHPAYDHGAVQDGDHLPVLLVDAEVVDLVPSQDDARRHPPVQRVVEEKTLDPGLATELIAVVRDLTSRLVEVTAEDRVTKVEHEATVERDQVGKSDITLVHGSDEREPVADDHVRGDGSE